MVELVFLHIKSTKRCCRDAKVYFIFFLCVGFMFIDSFGSLERPEWFA